MSIRRICSSINEERIGEFKLKNMEQNVLQINQYTPLMLPDNQSKSLSLKI